MKLGFHEIQRHLQQQLLPVYIVSGDEPLQHGEACDLIRQTARNQAYNDRKILDADSKFDWNELIAEANSLSLFAEQRILDLRIKNGKPGKEGGKALVEYCQHPPADTILLVSMPKLDQQQQKSKWFKSLAAIGAFIQVWPVTDQRLPPWIEERMRKCGLTPEKDVVQMLADRVEGNLLAASQEIEKLLLLNGPGVVSTAQLAASVADSARFDVFGLSDAALEGNASRCIRILEGLQHEGTPAVLVLWALSREIRQLEQISYAIATGTNPNAALQKFRIWDKRKPLINRAMQRLPLPLSQQLLIDCERADRAVKGQLRQDPWLLIEQICLRMCRSPISKLSA